MEPLTLIAGPCVIEHESTVNDTCAHLKEITENLNINLIFKASFDKANRTSFDGYRGPGFIKGLEMLREIKNLLGVTIHTDIHEPYQAIKAAEVCDMLQLPAFLARQTDLIKALAKTGKPINIKKPQFISPDQIKFIVQKFSNFGCEDVVVCERGSMYGYNQQIVDIIGLEIIKEQTKRIVSI